jgi:hypothetical protein
MSSICRLCTFDEKTKTKATERYKSLPLSQAPHFTLSLCSYVRIRRKNQSFFIMCVPTQTVLSLKYQVAQCLQEQQHEDAPSSARQLQIQTVDRKVLQDDDSLANLVNEQELYVCFHISDGEWEPVDIVSKETQMME